MTKVRQQSRPKYGSLREELPDLLLFRIMKEQPGRTPTLESEEHRKWKIILPRNKPMLAGESPEGRLCVQCAQEAEALETSKPVGMALAV